MNELTRIELLNDALKHISAPSPTTDTSLPNAYIIGCPRSGTTALLQWLASTKIWDFPTNLMARFSSSPYIGLLVQQMLQDMGAIGNLADISFESEYGRSKKTLDTNGFFHFFRRYLHINDIAHLTESQLYNASVTEMFKKLKEPSQLTSKPFLTKALMLQYNLPFFAPYCPTDLFLYIKRDPEFTMQSIYQARQNEFGSIHTWWSAKPAEYDWLKNKTPIEQIAGQVFFTEKAIEAGLEVINPKHYLVINYTELVQQPMLVLNRIIEKYSQLGVTLSAGDVEQSVLISADTRKIDDEILSALLAAHEKFAHSETESHLKKI